jgi:CTP synthase
MQVLELRQPGDPSSSGAPVLPTHPYFIAAQFHPELTSRPLRPQPMFMGLLAAAIERKYPGQVPPSDPAAADLARWVRRSAGQPVG